jgi:Tol biopolymer transport system component
MSVEVSAPPAVEFGKPRLLFRAPGTIDVGPGAQPGGIGAMSLSGDRLVFALPPTPDVFQLTLYDRSGKVMRTIGEPGQVSQPAFSPNGTKLAYLRDDVETGTVGIWTIDLETGRTTQVASDRYPKLAPTWSPDGSYIAYQSNRGTYTSIYRRKADGTGDEETLFRFTEGTLAVLLTDFSPDGQHVIFNDGGILGAAQLTGADPLARPEIEMLRDEYAVGFGRVSPDGRYIAYNSTESGNRLQMFVRPFDAGSATIAEQGKVQVTNDGLSGVKIWRGDGKEIFFVQGKPRSEEIHVMAVDIMAGPAVRVGAPKELFTVNATAGTTKFVSPDGEKFVFAIRQPAER